MITKLPSIASRTSRRLLHHSTARGAATAAATQSQWSGSLSYATPESDFTALHVSANSATVEAEWSQELSFASPDADFTAHTMPTPTPVHVDELHLQVSAHSATVESEWAQQILLKDAREDVAQLQANLESEQKLDEAALKEMLHQLQLSSPESAIGHTHVAETMTKAVQQDFESVLQEKGLPTTIPEDVATMDQAEVDRMMQHLHLFSPESALGVTHVAEVLTSQQKSELQSHYDIQGKELPNPLPENHIVVDDLLLQQMLLSSPESATGYVHAAETLTAPLLTELSSIATPLPTTLQEALQTSEHRAIVVTEATLPFRVVHVNAEWEGLCGYTEAEAQNLPIGDLLKGPETQASQQMVQGLRAHPETPQAALLVNYTKEGRKFRNRLQVGPLFGGSDNSEVEYLVGVLREVPAEEQGGMQMAA